MCVRGVWVVMDLGRAYWKKGHREPLLEYMVVCGLRSQALTLPQMLPMTRNYKELSNWAGHRGPHLKSQARGLESQLKLHSKTLS
jgi:hypothetical protein